MTFLLDTHLLLWVAADDPRLPAAAAELIRDPTSTMTFSPANIWEVVIKTAKGRLDFDVDGRALRNGLVRNGYRSLPITDDHALAAGALPPIHADPFDRILIAQATYEGFTLLTSDAVVASYPGPIIKF